MLEQTIKGKSHYVGLKSHRQNHPPFGVSFEHSIQFRTKRNINFEQFK